MLECGIYFNLDEDEYHSEPCLSTSGLKKLLVSAKDFWDESWMNPDRPVQEKKDYLEFGKAVHSFILEPETMDKYASSFVAPDDALKTNEDLKNWLKEKAIKPKSGMKKADLIQMVEDADASAPIAENLARHYYRENSGKTFIPAEDMEKIVLMEKMIACETEFLEIFKDGVPEVSMIWDCPHTGVRMKSRVDYLSIFIADLKTFSRKSRRPIDDLVLNEFLNFRYDIQMYAYNLGRNVTFQGIRDGTYKVVGEHDPKWLQYIIENSNDRFYFGFVESKRPFNVRVLDIESWRIPGQEHNQLFQQSEDSYIEGVNKFVHCMQTFGTKTPWRDENIVLHITDKDIPLYHFNK